MRTNVRLRVGGAYVLVRLPTGLPFRGVLNSSRAVLSVGGCAVHGVRVAAEDEVLLCAVQA